ncbi:MAG: large conductance mechanosensitive channel protein MscL, partial [Anaerolineaceae bacterium]|nr:large conductance mechanosensitive channel protein MscL [Anaerolineaceae bacterium]
MKKLISEFKDFILKGKAVDLAIGIIIGTGFGAIVNSLVNDVIMPPIGLLLGDVDFSDLYIILKQGATEVAKGSTLAVAKEAGAVTWNYGLFINTIVTFLIIAIVVFIIVRLLTKLQLKRKEEAPPEPDVKSCPFCF